MRNGLEKLEQKDYKEKLEAGVRPQFIFFTAEWSEPCRQMQSVVEQLALQRISKLPMCRPFRRAKGAESWSGWWASAPTLS